MTNSNLTKHRQALVSRVCDCMKSYMRSQGVDSPMMEAEFDCEVLVPKTRYVENIIDHADDCDGMIIHMWKPEHRDQTGIWVIVLWGNGVGSAISDFSATIPDEYMKPARDHCEFLEI